MRGARFVPIGCAMLLAVSPARGDELDPQALFDRGLAAMLEGRYEAGCAAILASYQIDPLPGTLFTLAECYGRAGRSASAVARYEELLSRLRQLGHDEREAQRERERIAGEELARLLPEVPTLSVSVADDAPAGTLVERDGRRLRPDEIGVPVRLDPGRHVVVARAPDGASATHHVVLAPRARESLELRIERSTAPTFTPQRARAAAPTGAAPAPDRRPELEDAGDPSRTWAFGLGLLGLGGIAVGSVTGLGVLSEKPTIDRHCRDHACDETGKAAADRAQSLGLVSTVGFGVGAAALGAAAIVLLLGPDPEPSAAAPRTPAPRVAPRVVVDRHGAFLGVGGSL